MTQQNGFPLNTLIKFALLLFSTGFMLDAAAQNRDFQNKEDIFLLRGNVSCRKPTAGPLLDVTVFNISRDLGTMSDSSGNFLIKMAKGDTIIFSTPLHKDYIFYLSEEDKPRRSLY
ncbi:MAG TPA: hypothetical protein PLV21_03680 [Cyclobacteriaceae bacterium]|nr:hypothetical protein [Cyclobacteriaceae bacterium]HRJ80959.1 hypothetical protein [Cyclobacteriaceae bacterium]